MAPTINPGRESSSPPDPDVVTKVHRRKRTGIACNSCRLHKTKCNGAQPCQMCIKRGWICGYDKHKRHSHKLSHSSKYVEVLEGSHHRLVQAVFAMYEKLVATGAWDCGEVGLNDHGEPIVHNIVSALLGPDASHRIPGAEPLSTCSSPIRSDESIEEGCCEMDHRDLKPEKQQSVMADERNAVNEIVQNISQLSAASGSMQSYQSRVPSYVSNMSDDTSIPLTSEQDISWDDFTNDSSLVPKYAEPCLFNQLEAQQVAFMSSYSGMDMSQHQSSNQLADGITLNNIEHSSLSQPLPDWLVNSFDLKEDPLCPAG